MPRINGRFSPQPRPCRPPMRGIWLILPTMCFVAMIACSGRSAWADGVKRRITIRTNPPGAMVEIDGQHLGRSPVSVYFTYYGTRRIRIVKEGFETLVVDQVISLPWWEAPGIDFFSENFVPGEIDDHRIYTFRLQPQAVVLRDTLLNEARQFRATARSEAASLGTVMAPRSALPPMPIMSTPGQPVGPPREAVDPFTSPPENAGAPWQPAPGAEFAVPPSGLTPYTPNEAVPPASYGAGANPSSTYDRRAPFIGGRSGGAASAPSAPAAPSMPAPSPPSGMRTSPPSTRLPYAPPMGVTYPSTSGVPSNGYGGTALQSRPPARPYTR